MKALKSLDQSISTSAKQNQSNPLYFCSDSTTPCDCPFPESTGTLDPKKAGRESKSAFQEEIVLV